jgi:hypothetical protein
MVLYITFLVLIKKTHMAIIFINLNGLDDQKQTPDLQLTRFNG